MDFLLRNALLDVIGYGSLLVMGIITVLLLMRGRALYKTIMAPRYITGFDEETQAENRILQDVSMEDRIVESKWKIFTMVFLCIGLYVFWNTMQYGFVRLKATNNQEVVMEDVMIERVTADPLTVQALERDTPAALQAAQDILDGAKVDSREEALVSEFDQYGNDLPDGVVLTEDGYVFEDTGEPYFLEDGRFDDPDEYLLEEELDDDS